MGETIESKIVEAFKKLEDKIKELFHQNSATAVGELPVEMKAALDATHDEVQSHVAAEVTELRTLTDPTPDETANGAAEPQKSDNQ
jgi:ClpP class serine protease